jgi:hypothetical protein
MAYERPEVRLIALSITSVHGLMAKNELRQLILLLKMLKCRSDRNLFPKSTLLRAQTIFDLVTIKTDETAWAQLEVGNTWKPYSSRWKQYI